MKFYLSLWLLICIHTSGQAQVKNYNKTKQVEQLQQLQQTVTRQIDSLQVQLPELAVSMENTRKKIDYLRKEKNNQDRPDTESKEQLSKLSVELITATNLADSLRKKFDMRLTELDKALNFQKDLEDKISALQKETN
ncbi:MAG: hypothetical protein ABIQ88_04160 [Chitinophagaceae bacterium]